MEKEIELLVGRVYEVCCLLLMDDRLKMMGGRKMFGCGWYDDYIARECSS